MTEVLKLPPLLLIIYLSSAPVSILTLIISSDKSKEGSGPFF